MRECKIITVANQKGGVSKTTVCQHLAYALTERGLRALCVDFDPQSNLTLSMLPEGVAMPELDIHSLLELLLADHTIPTPEHYIAHTKGGDIIPGSKALGRLESALLTEMGTEGFLKSILHPLRTSYDYILIDTNRAASPLMVNALTAADSVLIPINPEFYSTEGLSDLITTVLKNKRRLNPTVEFEGVLFSMCDTRTNLYREIRADVEAAFRDEMRIFRTAIPRTVQVGEAVRRGMTVLEYVPESRVSAAFRAFAEEVVNFEQQDAGAQGCDLHGGAEGACRSA